MIDRGGLYLWDGRLLSSLPIGLTETFLELWCKSVLLQFHPSASPLFLHRTQSCIIVQRLFLSCPFIFLKHILNTSLAILSPSWHWRPGGPTATPANIVPIMCHVVAYVLGSHWRLRWVSVPNIMQLVVKMQMAENFTSTKTKTDKLI
jgi:hypothetical protein